jgi:hypothetical protein
MKRLQPIIAGADDISYEVYCSVLDHVAGKTEAMEFKLPAGLSALFGNLNGWFKQIASEFKVSVIDLVEAFKQRDMFALMKALKFNLKLIWKALTAFTSLIPNGLMRVFEQLHKRGVFEKLKSGALKIDDLLAEYPVLKRLAGVALAGFLLWAWLSMSFTGDPEFDLNVAIIIAAVHGTFSLHDLFVSPAGLTMLTLLATGVFTGIGVAWLGSSIYNLVLALVYTGARKAHDGKLAERISHIIPRKKV